MSKQNKEDLLLEMICYITLLIHGVTGDGFYLKKYPLIKDPEEGSPMSYECLAVPSDHIIYKWSQNDRPIVLNHHRYLASDNRTLMFDHVDRDIDPGNYNCLAQNSTSKFTRKSRSGKLEVQWIDSEVEVKMIEPILKGDLKLGKKLQLKCNVNSFPKVTREDVRWFFSGRSEPPAGSRILGDGDLVIGQIESFHVGFYHCMIYHKAGKLSSLTPFILNMNDENLNPSDFSKYVKEQDKISLTCPWTSGKVVWSKKLRLLDPLQLISETSPNHIQITNDILTISEMDKESDGYYICQLVNVSQPQTAVFRVSLAKMYPLERRQFSPQLQESEPLIIREGENGGIRFYIDLTPANTFIFDKIPNPKPIITWEYNNIEIPKWDANNAIHPPRKYVYRNRHLIIQNATSLDRGVYTIKMKNIAGDERLNFKVEITFPPTFEEDFSKDIINVNEDQPVFLDCRIKKMAPESSTKIYWNKDGSPITMYMESLAYYNSGKSLRIEKAKYEHTGIYQCFVKTLGFPEFASRPQSVNVKAKLQFLGHNLEVFLEVNKNGNLHCKTKGYGTITISWYSISIKESEPSKLNRQPILHPHQILKNGTLIFKRVQKEYSGDYLCEAISNTTGEVINMTVKVKVGERPKITLITQNATIQEGTSLLLDCLASGDPKPTISWFMDNSLSQKQLITFDINKSFIDRKKLYQNGTLIIRNAGLSDEAKYTCFATNNQFVAAEESVAVKVLTAEEYSKLNENNNFNKGMVKTIIIVVSCALAYLALIIGLTAFCSLRMLRHRRNRSLTEKLADNSQLMRPLGGSNPNNGSTLNDTIGNKSSRAPVNNSIANLPQVPFSASQSYYNQYTPMSMPNYAMNPLIESHGSEFQHLMSAPPPTPLESRSNLSGNLSSTNSASLYTRSHLSNSTNGGGNGIGSNSMERLTYPRHELQTEGLLGKGEFGDVLLARARNILEGESQSLVVVKSLMHNVPSHYHEFHRQLDMLARTESDFVTKLLGICIELEPFLLILEYCEWGDLKQFLFCVQDRSNPNMPLITRPQKLSICLQIAIGMDHIASLRCVHKDLAARNVLVTPQLKIKISHLGLCRDIYKGEYYQDGDRILPIRWMPPESVLKNEFSLQTDVWSFAVTCWEIFSLGSLPMSSYKNEDILDTLASCSSLNHSKVQMMYSTLEHFPSECPQTMLSVVKRCLFLDPQNRPNFADIWKTLKETDASK